MSLCVDAQPFSLGSNQHMHSLCDHICPIALLPLPLLSPCNDCAPLAASGALLTRWAGGLRCCRACTSRSHTRSSRSLWRTHPPSTTAADGGCVPLLMRGAWQVCGEEGRRRQCVCCCQHTFQNDECMCMYVCMCMCMCVCVCFFFLFCCAGAALCEVIGIGARWTQARHHCVHRSPFQILSKGYS